MPSSSVCQALFVRFSGGYSRIFGLFFFLRYLLLVARGRRGRGFSCQLQTR